MNAEKPLVAGRYRLDQLIGRGGMGDVYRGTDITTDMTVAVKLLHPNIVEENPGIVDRFNREGEALRRLNHPNIVTMLDMVETEGQHYLVMEYVTGGSLRDLIDEQERLPIEGVLNVALDLTDALTRAHRLDIIHRDIKPDNVLLAEDGTPRLTDFGVAYLGDRTRLTQTGSVVGTYAYLSPEACNGMVLDERADIWSFGVMLFEMLAGRVPFMEASTAAILTAILTKPAPDLSRLRPETPPALLNLIRGMLEKDRERRISSVRLVGAELEAIIREIDTPLREKVQQAGYNMSVGSRFATPSDERPASDVPAMESSAPDQTHGFSLFPGQQQATGPQLPGGTRAQYPPGMTPVTPGGTPMTTAEMAQIATRKWQFIALMVIVTVLACSTVAVIALLFGPESGGDDTGDEAAPHAPPGGPPPTVEPVGPDELMVLVAPLEYLGTGDSTSDASRFILDDLRESLQETAPFSNIVVRQYPDVITGDDQARAAAEVAGATVVLWGNYSADLIEVEVQVGVLDAFPYNAFDRDLLERNANVRLHMTDARRESAAPYVLNVISILQGADGDGYGSMRTGAIQDLLAVKPADVVGNSIAAHLHRALYGTEPTEALEHIEAARELDAGNALVYVFSSMIKQRQLELEAARRDLRTAQRLGPDSWSMPILLLASLAEDPSVVDMFNTVIEQRPDDWFPYFFRGAIYYDQGGDVPGAWELARQDLERAMALTDEANFPYIYSALLALHEARLDDAAGLVHTILTEFPDPEFMERLIRATFGEGFPNPYSATLSAFVNLSLGRYEDVIDKTETALLSFPEMVDLRAMQGIAYCSLDDYSNANRSFTTALSHDPDFTLLHLLRASTRLAIDDELAAEQDFRAIQSSPYAEAFAPYAALVRSGDLTCKNFIGLENPMFHPDGPAAAGGPDTVEATPVPPGDPALAAIEPVPPDRYMILVADLERLGNIDERDVARFIAEDLERTLQETTYSAVAIRRYPDVITSDTVAQEVAESAGATVIVWGRYTPEAITVEVQAGVTDAFPYIAFERATVARTANVRVEMENERRESVAVPVMNVINLLALADGDEFEWTLLLTVLDSLDTDNTATIQGNNTAARAHRALLHYVGDTSAALSELDRAINADAGNALLYALRSLTHLRLGNIDDALLDITTASRLGPDEWAMPLYFAAEDDPEAAMQVFADLKTLRPDDWFAYFLEAMAHYDGFMDLETAKAQLDESIARDPEANLPYIVAMLIALREGDIVQAQDYAGTILTEFPDPELANRAFGALYGESQMDILTGMYFEAGTNIILGQYSEILNDMQTLREIVFGGTVVPGLLGDTFYSLSDMFLMEGVAACNLKQYDTAEEAYTQAIKFSRDYALAYVLRAQVQQRLGDREGAAEDFANARERAPGDTFDAWIDAAEARDWTCENLLDYTLPAE